MIHSTKWQCQRALWLRSVGAIALSTVIFGANAQHVFAQEADGDENIGGEVEQIVVTGSRIRRDAFSANTPTQVLDAGENRKLGVSSLSEMLQRSTTASGQQIDGTFNSNAGNSNATEAPPDGGIGSSNIDLRGLGAERTLILVNGRRLGVAGARGAPAQPDIGLIPLGMVETADVLTGGYSTIYGADAVAGVVNVRLKSDFEGLEVFGNVELPEAGGGELYQTSLVGGVASDRGNITFGFEYRKQERASTGSRDFSSCLRSIEVSENGDRFDPCRSGFFDNVVVISDDFVPGFEPGAPFPGTGPDGLTFTDALFFFYTPGQSDTGVPNFSTGFNLPAAGDPQVGAFPGEDPDAGSVFPFLDFFNDQDERRAADLIRPAETFSFVTNGHFNMDWGNNEELYYESYYFNRKNNVIASKEQIFPDIAGMIPQEDANGNIIVDADGAPILVDNPLNPFPVSVAPIITLDDNPQDFNVNVEQVRFVGGLRGDIGAGWFKEKNWSYDMFFSYDRGTGHQSQSILFEPNLILATQTLRMNADGEVICGVPLTNNQNGLLTPNECVPVNFFAPSIFEDGEGRFSSDAERDFLVGLRTNRTVTKQYNASAFFTGDLFDIPGGDTVGTAVGFEWRKDTINSQNDISGVQGLNVAENPLQEGITQGQRWIYDIYGEFTAPLMRGKSFVELLQLDGSVRYTEEQNFGSEVTWRIMGTYRPVDYLTFIGSRSTSFRAPNLREQFLADQGQGVSGALDPCRAQAITQLDPTDPQTQLLINNCELSGADTTQLGNAGVVTIPVNVGGSDDLIAETSTSVTGTVQFTQPWFNSFDWDLAATYYDIEIKNTVSELDAGVIIARCFNDDPNLASPFCDRVTRADTGNRANNALTLVDASFINVGLETVTGIDIESRFHKNFDDVMGQSLDLTWSVGANRLIEQNRLTFTRDDLVDNAGRIGNPKWQFNSTVSLLWDRYQLLWQARYIGQTEFDEDIQNPEEAPSDNTDFVGSVLTFDDAVADRRLYNDLSLSADFDLFALTFGVSNITDQDPPLIDSSEGPNRNNAVTSSGFDLFGRTFFMNATMRF
ncbi:TonB-dependent receptor [Iodidimonas muriae]|uniref:TonB-dependent receptor n=1 Tax=Iodidimonas muriae TaxID=261467 RepID=A0ABQ2LHX5_9PROT|nr:TonB-dependent receptor [Iodidimonas muriae]GGO16711.1 TonB-dependent receptor [Iodidimonas muriae]